MVMTEEKVISMNTKDIEKLLPHRYPFLMVDRATEIVPGQSGKGYKLISANEPQFQGHFPGIPIFPGVLQMEALAQLACLVILQLPEYKEGYIGLFTGMDNVKFKKMALPGDKLNLEVTLNKFRFPFGKFDVKAEVDGELCCSGTISFAMAERSVLSE